MDCRAATVGRGTGFVAGTRAIAGLAALACGLVPAPSRADGAFPDSQTILVPAAHPDEVIHFRRNEEDLQNTLSKATEVTPIMQERFQFFLRSDKGQCP